MAKLAYTYPELAAYLKKIFSDGPCGWGGLQKHMEEVIEKTVDEMFDNKELFFQKNIFQLPPPPVKHKIKRQTKYDRYTTIEKANRQVIQEMINYGDLAPEQLPPPVKDNVARRPRKSK